MTIIIITSPPPKPKSSTTQAVSNPDTAPVSGFTAETHALNTFHSAADAIAYLQTLEE